MSIEHPPIQLRRIDSPQATELFITAAPAHDGWSAAEAERLFSVIASILRQNAARLWMERVFVPAELFETTQTLRAAAYGDLADGVEPSWLISGGPGLGGVQVHALANLERSARITPCLATELSMAPASRRCEPGGAPSRLPIGRTLDLNGIRWIAASGLGSPAANAESETRAAFIQAHHLLAAAGADFRSVGRTWFFLDDILSWYPAFNTVRNELFREHGLIAHAARPDYLPASTGIGVRPARGRRVELDLIAAAGPEARIICHQAAGRQRSAFAYGSAFSRATQMPTPAGRTLYVSGTAAIDAEGFSRRPGDAPGQIAMTLENVLAVVSEAGFTAADITQAIAYCATPAVAAEFTANHLAQPGWPWITVIGDVCRPELLFEAEVTATKPHGQ